MLTLYVKLWGDVKKKTVHIFKNEETVFSYPPSDIIEAIEDRIKCDRIHVKEIEIVRADGEDLSLNFNAFFYVDTFRFKYECDVRSFLLNPYGALKVSGLFHLSSLMYCEMNIRTEVEDLDKIMEKNPDLNINFEDA